MLTSATLQFLYEISRNNNLEWFEKNKPQVRSAIVRNPSEFHKLLSEPEIKSKYGAIRGERNKMLPPEFRTAGASEPLLYHNQFYFMAELAPETVLKPDFPQIAGQYFKAGYALNRFFRQAMGI